MITNNILKVLRNTLHQGYDYPYYQFDDYFMIFSVIIELNIKLKSRSLLNIHDDIVESFRK